ncbi:unnamed protein product [Mycena citricolor]|uniref:Uncharacterized protein n=1 Tax=Mycena citricolor TaxID=2018698 RepID=A0AAD2HTL1_9AGAR|nr:unnamed protein product [Mycena citricolor]
MTLAHSPARVKQYADRAVQTECHELLDAHYFKVATPRVDGSPKPYPLSHKSSKRKIMESPVFEAAYSHSPPQATLVGPTRSPSSRKHVQLPYSRPSAQVYALSQRVTSLPEPSIRKTQPIHETRRVSLSEYPNASIRHSLSFTDNMIESASPSVETSFETRSGSVSSRARRSLPSSDMPHTPSPPSSPESVMIIGNHMQVPISFLQNKTKSRDVYDENGGWISWSDSPPKPIPALHGPLSLPYARCPSGAEGTIIEGEDLSRMIWGLGLEDPGNQTTHSRTNSAHVGHSRTASLGARGPVQAEQKSRHYSVNDWIPMPDENECVFPRDKQGGLGLDLRKALKPQPVLESTNQRIVALKPSAPAFIPASLQEISPRIFVEPRGGHTIQPSLRLSAFELAQQFQRAQNTLPTPPPSSSPQWSPQLAQPQMSYVDPFPPLDIHALVPFKPGRPLAPFSPGDFGSPPPPGPPPNTPLPALPVSGQPSPRVLGRMPRSVPFARMLQRRLSAVPEEEGVRSPPPSPPKLGGPPRLSRPPRAPSHATEDAFKPRSQWKHNSNKGVSRDREESKENDHYKERNKTRVGRKLKV